MQTLGPHKGFTYIINAEINSADKWPYYGYRKYHIDSFDIVFHVLDELSTTKLPDQAELATCCDNNQIVNYENIYRIGNNEL